MCVCSLARSRSARLTQRSSALSSSLTDARSNIEIFAAVSFIRSPALCHCISVAPVRGERSSQSAWIANGFSLQANRQTATRSIHTCMGLYAYATVVCALYLSPDVVTIQLTETFFLSSAESERAGERFRLSDRRARE